ncbi:MAG: hypothetical protein ABH862_03660 [Candidatus Omnitrophota bacterium]
MGKILGLVIGTAAICGGVILLMMWRQEVVIALKAVTPGILILGGAIAIASGISEFIDTVRASGENK